MRVRSLLALLLGIITAAAIGCGDSSSLLSNADAVGLKDELALVDNALDSGDCVEASRAAARFRTAAGNLPTSVDPELRANIRQGAEQLVTQVRADCRRPKTVTTETTTTTETTPTTTTPTTTTPTTTTESIPTIPETLPTVPVNPGGAGGGTGGTGGPGGDEDTP
jgi:hypothetical protein